MKIEHFAFNVKDPVAQVKWFCEHLNFTVKFAMPAHPFTHFIADQSGQVMLEIYNNPVDQVPDYHNQNPLIMHVAFVSAEPYQDCQRLEKAGAKKVDEVNLPDGSLLIMMKDPWGVSIQLCRRGKPMI